MIDTKKLWIPLALGVAVVVWMLASAVRETGWDALRAAELQSGWGWALGFTVLTIVARVGANMARLRLMSGGGAGRKAGLGWRQAGEVIGIWEFSSAITPGIVGGGAVGIWAMTKEGLSAGRGTSIVVATALLDQAFFLVAVPIVIGSLQGAAFPDASGWMIGNAGLQSMFWLAWALTMVITLATVVGIASGPRILHRSVSWLFGWRLLTRWHRKAVKFAIDTTSSAGEIRRLPLRIWLKAAGWTLVSWLARFATLAGVMGLVLAPLRSLDGALLLGRQLVLWVIMLVSPTPGSSGVAEWGLNGFFGEMGGPTALALTALAWRTATSFIFLVGGLLVVPGWQKRLARTQEK
jgi:uncharacterized membrane protein YbhN (UPF0104 family)